MTCNLRWSMSKWCRFPSCRDWHCVLTRVLGRLSLFLVFGVWTGVFPSWRTEQQLVKDTLTYTHASKSESLGTPACSRGHTPPPPPSLCLGPCPFLCPPPAFILSSIIYDWGTLSRSTTPSTRCQHWPVNGSLLYALTSLRSNSPAGQCLILVWKRKGATLIFSAKNHIRTKLQLQYVDELPAACLPNLCQTKKYVGFTSEPISKPVFGDAGN